MLVISVMLVWFEDAKKRQLTITIANRYYVILIAPTVGVQLHMILINT